MSLLEPLESRRLMAAGELDPTFGTGGLVQLAEEEPRDGVVETLPDGRVLVAFMGRGGDLHLQRLMPSGATDLTFGEGDGLVRHPDVPPDIFMSAIDIQPLPSGKFLVATSAFSVARFNADGSLDPSFGDGGVASTAQHGEFGQSGAMAVAPDGRIALLGSRSAFMYRPDGSPDPNVGFGTPGLFFWSIREPHDILEPIGAVFTPRGTLVVAGNVLSVTTYSWVAEIDPTTRTLDPIWNTTSAVNEVRDVALLADGSVLVAGQPDENGREGVVVKLTPSGAPDTTFGNGGQLRLETPPLPPFATDASYGAAGIEVLPDGRFYVLGRQQPVMGAVADVFDLNRYLPDGTPDGSFGGRVNVHAGPHVPSYDFGPGAADNVLLLVNKKEGFVDGPITLRRFDGSGPRLTRRGTLLISGTSGDDAIHITRRVRDGRILVEWNGDGRVFLPQLVRRIQLYAHGGDDLVTIGPGVRSAFLHGGDGDDRLVGGDGDDLLVGAVGNDSLTGGLGNDSLEGNAGNDYLLGSAGHDQIHGHGGRDHLIGAGGNDRLFGGPNSADIVHGGPGTDAAASDPLDSYDGVEEMLV